MAYRILLFLLLTIPISFKVEVIPGVRFLVQEPFLVFFVIACNVHTRKIRKEKSFPFLFFHDFYFIDHIKHYRIIILYIF